MELTAGKVAVVTGAASGIGLALAGRFARAGLDVVLADVEQPALRAASEKIAGLGGKTLAVPTDVSDEAAVNALAAAAVDRFGAVHVVCNNAGVASLADPWSGPLSAWRWVLGVNLWGVIHGIRAFLPVLAAQGEGHIVNTASVAGLVPGIGPSYDATKHAVVAISEDLYQAMNVAMLPVGVSVLCPGWVRTSIAQADRNWSQSLGEVPPRAATAEVTEPHVQRAIDEGMAPAAVADLVADAITANRFWVFTDPHFTQMALDRWQRIAEGRNPQADADMPGLPPAKQLIAEIQQLLAGPAGALRLPAGPGPPADGTTWSWMTTGRAARRTIRKAALSGVMSLQYEVLTVALPLWILEHTSCQRCIVSPLLILNTVLVVFFQVRASRRAVRTRLHASLTTCTGPVPGCVQPRYWWLHHPRAVDPYHPVHCLGMAGLARAWPDAPAQRRAHHPRGPLGRTDKEHGGLTCRRSGTPAGTL